MEDRDPLGVLLHRRLTSRRRPRLEVAGDWEASVVVPVAVAPMKAVADLTTKSRVRARDPDSLTDRASG